MWLKNHYKERDDPEFTKPVHDVSGLLDRVYKFGDAGDASERLQDASIMYLIAEHGIGVLGMGFKLGEDFPSGDRFEQIGWALNRSEDDDYEPFTLSPKERTELEEEAKTLAKELLKREYVDLCSPAILTGANTQNTDLQSLRWHEDRDYPGFTNYVGKLLEHTNKTNYSDDPRRPQDAHLTYTMAVHGIAVLGDNFNNLPDNFPSREKIERLGWNLEFQKLCSDEAKCNEIIEQSKDLAKELLLNEFADLCTPEILAWANKQDRSVMGQDNNRTPASVKEILDGISKGSIDPQKLDESQKTGIQLYLVAQHGIEASGYLTELNNNYPYREQFQPIKERMAYEENYFELHRLNESSKTLAESILEKDFPAVFEELKANRQSEDLNELSYRWPENDDFLNESGQGIKM